MSKARPAYKLLKMIFVDIQNFYMGCEHPQHGHKYLKNKTDVLGRELKLIPVQG
jgi:hypothetical protein